MKNMVRLALALCALALAAPAAAQQSPAAAPQSQRPMIGVGVSIVPLDGAGVVPTIEVYVPIRIAPAFRLEPSLGIFTEDPDGDANNNSDITLGIGAFWVKQIAPAADMYAGGRLKLNFASEENPAPIGDQSDTDLILAGALGGEYYFAPQFSLGLEAQLGLFALGDVSGDASGFFTSGLAFLRLYF